MDTMQSEWSIPATNWMAPDTPQVMISFGRTVLPLNPTWHFASTHPASASGLVQATCPSNSSANSLIIARSSSFLIPRPATTKTSADSINSFFTISNTSTCALIFSLSIAHEMISPCVSSVLSGAFMTLYLTVAICGRLFGVKICAMMFPPNAGLIWERSVFSSISRIVQSAVNPVFILAATLGANCLPTVVAPVRIAHGWCFLMKSSNTDV